MNYLVECPICKKKFNTNKNNKNYIISYHIQKDKCFLQNNKNNANDKNNKKDDKRNKMLDAVLKRKDKYDKLWNRKKKYK